MRKGIFGLSAVIREEMKENPQDNSNVYIFLSKSRRIVKLLHYEHGFFILYEKRPVYGKFKKPLYDDKTKKYQISWSDMVCLTESLVISSMRLEKVG